MGRTFKSVRMGSLEVADRWLKASRALSKSDQVYGRRLAEMAKIHSSEGFYALDDPLEAAVFSALMELLKENDRKRDETAGGAKDGEAVEEKVERKVEKRVDNRVDDEVEKKDDVDI